MEAANLQNPLNEQLQQQQQQQQQLIINADQEQLVQQQQQQQFIINEDDQEQDFDNYGEQSDEEEHYDLDKYAEQRSSDEEEEEVNVSKRVYVLDEIDPHPLRCNLCPETTFAYPKGVKKHRKDKHGLYKFQCHCGFLYFTDQDRERHKSDRHPKAPKQKKCAKKRKKAR